MDRSTFCERDFETFFCSVCDPEIYNEMKAWWLEKSVDCECQKVAYSNRRKRHPEMHTLKTPLLQQKALMFFRLEVLKIVFKIPLKSCPFVQLCEIQFAFAVARAERGHLWPAAVSIVHLAARLRWHRASCCLCRIPGQFSILAFSTFLPAPAAPAS